MKIIDTSNLAFEWGNEKMFHLPKYECVVTKNNNKNNNNKFR